MAHDVKTNLKEVGITADILVEILRYHKKKGIPIGVIAQEGKNEPRYGSDIDVFVEVQRNKYVWYALQAKLLKVNNIYDEFYDYDPSKGERPQWEKLHILEYMAKCKAYYLLYNGKRGFFRKGLKSDCGKKYKTAQFGCSLVEPELVASLESRKDSRGHQINPIFEDFHPMQAEPWNILTCCPIKSSNLATYSLNEIIQSRKKGYKVLSDFGKIGGIDLIPFLGNNRIMTALLESKWESDITYIMPLSNS
ncbi:MAG: hypothetical protein IT286_03960 [Proteobacteria bacterium]|nr:hypothetical protein [Pseudomonadota bacterium]